MTMTPEIFIWANGRLFTRSGRPVQPSEFRHAVQAGRPVKVLSPDTAKDVTAEVVARILGRVPVPQHTEHHEPTAQEPEEKDTNQSPLIQPKKPADLADQERILSVCKAPSFTLQWNDDESGAKYSVAYWSPNVPAWTGSGGPDFGGWFVLGHYGQDDWEDPDGFLLLVRRLRGAHDLWALDWPARFEPVWNDGGSEARMSCSLWRPVPKPGYRAMGLVCKKGHDYKTAPKPSWGKVVCVHESLVTEAEAGAFLWNDKDSSGADIFSSWTILPKDPNKGLETGCFTGSRSRNKPTHKLYSLSTAHCSTKELEKHYLDPYLKALKAERSVLKLKDRVDLIQKCMPVWIIHDDEEYFPKPFQTYRVWDVKRADPVDQRGHAVNLIPYENRDNHRKWGRYNQMHVDENLIPGNHTVGGHGVKLIDPRAAPTYVFYHETSGVEGGVKVHQIWIRYFLFFGYDDFDGTGIFHVGDHYADWVHVAVRLRKQSGEYRPDRYYFAAHDGGKAYSPKHSDLGYYTKESGYAESKFADSGPWHVGAFCAKGTHECYPTKGAHMAVKISSSPKIDHTDYGYAVIPFGDGQSKNGKFSFSPVYAWDMTDPKFMHRDPRYYSEHVPHAPFVACKPRELLFTDISGDFDGMWLAHHEKQWKPIVNCGFEKAKAPSVKVFDWAGNFDE